MHSNIVNDNGFFKTPLDITNDNVKGKYDTANRVEIIANTLVEKFSAQGNFKYYCQVAYKLSEAKIWNNYEAALKGKTPVKLFTFLCNKDMNSAR